MLRGTLDNAAKSAINAELPDLDELNKASIHLDAELISIRFGHEPKIPVAAVCLRDAIRMLSASRFAMYEAYAHQLWYRHYASTDHSELAALWHGRFFADDAALRLYAAGEHLAQAIVVMLRISAGDLKPYRDKYKSRQTVVGNYLSTELPEHQITKMVIRLHTTPEWMWTRDYRDEWVHEQPPLMEGFGRQFDRKPKWKPVEGAPTPQKSLSIGTLGDSPKYTVDELLSNVQGALFAVSATTTALLEYYFQLLENEGARFR
jgi:hypothetical protein